MGVLIIIFIIAVIVRGRNVKGSPNTIRGEVIKVSGLSNDVDPYVVVSSMGEMAHRTEYRIRPGETVVFEESFAWSVSPRGLERFKSVGKVRFEVYNMKGGGYSVSDPSLGAVEIPVSDLFTEGQIEKVEALRLRTKKGLVINVKIGIFAEHSFFQSLNRFVQSWRLRRREVSFWARVFSIPLSFFLIVFGLDYFSSKTSRVLGITDVSVGAVIGFTILPHMLHWIGLSFLDAIRMESLLSAFSLYVSCVSTMAAISRYFGPSDPLDALAHLLLMMGVCVMALMFLIGDLRSEPGASCLGSSVGSIFSSLCGCCFGGRGALLRRQAL